MEREKRERELAEHRDRDIRMRDEMMRRGAMRPGLPGLPHDPYLEASRRYAQAAQAAGAALASDPLVRLQMAGINPDVRNQVSAHPPTHLHMHPDAAAAAMLLAQPPGFPGLPGYRPPGPF